MIFVQISNKIDGVVRMYEKLGKQGRHKYVPAYSASMSLADGSYMFNFKTTRDTSPIIFGEHTERYGTLGECPPSRVGSPFHAVVHEGVQIKRGLRLYDPGCKQSLHLYGEGDQKRECILIHHGPARSEGCFIIAGGEKGFEEWWIDLQTLLRLCENKKILVEVQPRPAKHYQKYLT